MLFYTNTMPKRFLDSVIKYYKQNPEACSKTHARPLRSLNAEEEVLLNEEQKKEGKFSNYMCFVFAENKQLSLEKIQKSDQFPLVQHIESVQVTMNGTSYCCGIIITKELQTPFSIGRMLQRFGFLGVTIDMAMWQHFVLNFQEIKECFQYEELYEGHKVNWFTHTVPIVGPFKLENTSASTNIAVDDSGRKRPRE